MSGWIKFHDSLRKGDKRGLSRASRFVFLELAIESRPTDGVLRLARGMNDVDAVHDLIGGDRKEIRKALDELCATPADPDDDPMIRIEGDTARTLTIPSFLAWNRPDKNVNERVRALRLRRKGEQNADLVYFLRSELRGEIKIGHSENVRDRIANICIEHGEKLELLGTIEGGFEKEIELHQRFARFRTAGEWFQETDELLALARSSNALGNAPGNARVTAPEKRREEERREEKKREEEEKILATPIGADEQPPRKPRSKARVISGSDHGRVIAAYHDAFFALRSRKPVIDSRTGQAASKLLASMPADEACATIADAFADDFFCKTGGELWQIANAPNKYRKGTARPTIRSLPLPVGAVPSGGEPVTSEQARQIRLEILGSDELPKAKTV